MDGWMDGMGEQHHYYCCLLMLLLADAKGWVCSPTKPPGAMEVQDISTKHKGLRLLGVGVISGSKVGGGQVAVRHGIAVGIGQRSVKGGKGSRADSCLPMRSSQSLFGLRADKRAARYVGCPVLFVASVVVTVFFFFFSFPRYLIPVEIESEG